MSSAFLLAWSEPHHSLPAALRTGTACIDMCGCPFFDQGVHLTTHCHFTLTSLGRTLSPYGLTLWMCTAMHNAVHPICADTKISNSTSRWSPCFVGKIRGCPGWAWQDSSSIAGHEAAEAWARTAASAQFRGHFSSSFTNPGTTSFCVLWHLQVQSDHSGPISAF